MNDIIKSIKASLYDRAASPLFGSFALAWIIWNFRAVIVLFSNASLWDKFSNLDALFNQPILWIANEPFLNFLHSFGVPAIGVLIYIYIYPVISIPIYKHSLEKQVELKK